MSPEIQENAVAKDPRKTRNTATLIILVAIIVLLFFITIVKIKNGG